MNASDTIEAYLSELGRTDTDRLTYIKNLNVALSYIQNNLNALSQTKIRRAVTLTAGHYRIKPPDDMLMKDIIISIKGVRIPYLETTLYSEISKGYIHAYCFTEGFIMFDALYEEDVELTFIGTLKHKKIENLSDEVLFPDTIVVKTMVYHYHKKFSNARTTELALKELQNIYKSTIGEERKGLLPKKMTPDRVRF